MVVLCLCLGLVRYSVVLCSTYQDIYVFKFVLIIIIYFLVCRVCVVGVVSWALVCLVLFVR